MSRVDATQSSNNSSRILIALLGFVALGEACGARTDLLLSNEGIASQATGGSGGNSAITTSTGGDGTTGTSTLPPKVCVFDYDLTLSSHLCPDTTGKPEAHCRVTTCDTYGWFDQCLATAAREAIATCVRENAFIGIASKASADACWNDKVTPIITEDQFPEWISATKPSADGRPPRYPRIDDRANWNCNDCAYTMDGAVSKPDGIRRIMRHYGLDPRSPSDRARVIFWDDTTSNITDVNRQMPEVRAVKVPSFTGNGVDGGCGMTKAEIEQGFAP